MGPPLPEQPKSLTRSLTAVRSHVGGDHVTQAQIAKIWFVVSAVLLYYALNTWIVVQGGNEIFGAKLVVSNKTPAAMIAIPICTILLFAASCIGRFFALRGGPLWHRRIPIVGFEDIDTGSREGRIYQGAMLSIFSIIPAIALIFFWHAFVTATVMLNDGSKKPVGLFDWTVLAKTINDPARICTDFMKDLPDPCVANGTVLPGLEPTVFAVLTLMAIAALVAHWTAVLGSSQSVEVQAAPTPNAE